MKPTLTIATLCVVLCGCAAPPLNQTLISGIHVADLAAFADNKTTQRNVLASLGQPSRKEAIFTKEVWKYDYTEYNYAKGVDINETTVFEFDAQNVLLAHYKTQGSVPSPLPSK